MRCAHELLMRYRNKVLKSLFVRCVNIREVKLVRNILHIHSNDVITCHVISSQLTVKCHCKTTAPCGMSRGSATTDGQFAYFTPYDSTLVYRYEWRGEKWEELPSCPHRNSGLVIIDGKLTAVGGYDASHHTNKLFTLRQKKWVEEYPPMNTFRSEHTIVSTSDGEYLIVIGGGGAGWTATVELLQVKSRRWYKLTDLPQPLPRPSATICGDQLNVIGHDANANGYSCSLQTLPSRDQPITSPLTLSWKPFPPLPVRYSTAATLCGQLVLIGGWRRHGSSVNSIHQLVDGVRYAFIVWSLYTVTSLLLHFRFLIFSLYK